MQAADGFIPVPGARLYYRDSGGPGTPVVFLHASSGNAECWEKQVPAFSQAGYRVIAYDRRGWGRSTQDPADAQPWTATSDLLALARHLQLGRFHLIGTALGGFVVFDFALSHPELMRSAVVANSWGGFQDEEITALDRRMRPKGFMDMPAELYELGPEYRASHPEGVRAWHEHEKRSRQSAQSKTPLDHPRRLSLLETVEVPFLLLTGGADLVAPSAFQDIFAKHLKNSERAVIPNAGHSAFWEAPELFNRTVLTFLVKHK